VFFRRGTQPEGVVVVLFFAKFAPALALLQHLPAIETESLFPMRSSLVNHAAPYQYKFASKEPAHNRFEGGPIWMN
jgi:hypothetical protein